MKTLLPCALLLLALIARPTETEEFWPDGTLKARYETVESESGEAVPHGKYASFHENGKKHETGSFEDGVRTGKWTIRWENGRRRAEGKFANGQRSGKWKLFDERGKKAWEGKYQGGRRTGNWKAFDSKGEVDTKRSGKIEFHEGSRGSTGLRWTGERLKGKRDGTWQCLRDDGTLAATGKYTAGCPVGDWHFFLADGTFEAEWLSGVYSFCKRTGPVKKAPANSEASNSRLRVDAQAEENFAAWIDQPSEAAAKELVKEAKLHFPVAVNRLLDCKLDERAGWERGKQIHDEFLSQVFGAIGEWTDFDAPDAARKNAHLAQRWRAAWELGGTIEELWPAETRPKKEIVLKVLANNSLKGTTGDLPLAASTPVIGIGAGAGGSFGGRFGGRRNLRAMGGAKTEEPLADGLRWLVTHQAEDGSWHGAEFEGKGNYDVGITGLALLALLGDGNSTRGGKYKESVTLAVKWLRTQQDATTGFIGSQRGHDFNYNHAIATFALAEAYYFSKSPLLRPSVVKAVDYIKKARNPYAAWRYSPTPDGSNDVSVTTWMVLALKTAERSGIDIEKEVYDYTLQFLDAMTDPQNARTGYDEPGAPSARIHNVNNQFPTNSGEAMTSAALFTRYFLEQRDKNPVMPRQADLLLKKLPEWDVESFGCDMYYWYYGTYAMFQAGGKHWKHWNDAMKKAILPNQRVDGDFKGSWDPVGPWGHAGGRVYSTAMMCLCLEVYFRYARLVGR